MAIVDAADLAVLGADSAALEVDSEDLDLSVGLAEYR